MASTLPHLRRVLKYSKSPCGGHPVEIKIRRASHDRAVGIARSTYRVAIFEMVGAICEISLGVKICAAY